VREDELAYYSTPGPMTTLDPNSDALQGLPTDPLTLGPVVQGLILHEFWADRYGVEIPPARADEVETRAASAMVELILRLDPAPLSTARPPERRMFGNCRHFSTLSCALLRRSGIPSRARCGFATYFEPDRYIDHWLVEYWEPTRARWRRVDNQLDNVQRQALALDFDPTDVPAGRFLDGAEAWQLCQAGRADPERFGILDFWGLWFVRNNVVRDLAALNKMELLPWDGWGIMNVAEEQGGAPAIALVDELAAAILADDWLETRRRYEENDLIRVPEQVLSYRAGTTVPLPV
jgi:Transglutaminase-like superfamily